MITVAAGLFGGFVRGFSGFGFSLAAVPVLSLVLAPNEAVPAVLPMEVLLGLATIPSQRRHVSWATLKWLLMGTLVGTPVGLAMLSSAPAPVMRAAVGAVALLGVVILWCRPQIPGLLGPRWLSISGFVSGCLNGGTAMSGPPVIIALLGSTLSAQVARATLMAFIAASALLAALAAEVNGLYGGRSAFSAMIMLPVALLGGWAGTQAFRRTSIQLYRPASLAILIAITAVALVVTALNLGDLRL
jgi:uncharacterized membrane protein YfcA